MSLLKELGRPNTAKLKQRLNFTIGGRLHKILNRKLSKSLKVKNVQGDANKPVSGARLAVAVLLLPVGYRVLLLARP